VLWDSVTGVDLATSNTMRDMLCHLEQVAGPPGQQRFVLSELLEDLALPAVICFQAARAQRWEPAMNVQSRAS
jgi:hypothetical protein